MTIKERNIEIAKMLNYKKELFWFNLKTGNYVKKENVDCDLEPLEIYVKNSKPIRELNFHNDLNWLQEAIIFINKTHNMDNPHRDLLYTSEYLMSGGWFLGSQEKIPKRLYHGINDLFQAVSDFAKLYNNEEI